MHDWIYVEDLPTIEFVLLTVPTHCPALLMSQRDKDGVGLTVTTSGVAALDSHLKVLGLQSSACLIDRL